MELNLNSILRGEMGTERGLRQRSQTTSTQAKIIRIPLLNSIRHNFRYTILLLFLLLE